MEAALLLTLMRIALVTALLAGRAALAEDAGYCYPPGIPSANALADPQVRECVRAAIERSAGPQVWEEIRLNERLRYLQDQVFVAHNADAIAEYQKTMADLERITRRAR
jgi:hypothetical protein